MGKVKKLTAGGQVVLIFGLISAALLAIGLFLFFSLRTIERHNEELQTQILKEWVLSNDLSRSLSLEQNEVFQHIDANTTEDIQRHEQIISSIKEAQTKRWNDYGMIVDNPTEVELYAKALQARKDYWDETETLLTFSRVNRDREARELAFTRQVPTYQKYQKTILDIADWTAKEGGEMATASTRRIVQTRTVGNGLVGLAMLITIGTGLGLVGITRRLKEDNVVLLDEVAERKRTQETLRESDEKFRQMAENITDMFWMTSPDMQRVLYVSPAYESIWGQSPESLYAHPGQWAEAIPPEDRERVFTLFSTLGKGGASASTEFQITRPDGEVRWIYGRGFPVQDSAGRVIRLTGIASDITERKKVEIALRESDEKFRQLAENITDVFWITSADLQKILYVSPAYERVWGRSAASAYAHPQEWAEAILPEEREGVFALFSKLSAGMPSLSTEFRIVRPDGNVRWIHSRGFPVRDDVGNVIRLTGIASDITERKRDEEMLRLLNSAVLQSREAITITDANLDLPGPTIIFVNPAFTQMTGYTAEEATGKTPRILQGPNTDKAVLRQLRQTLEQGKVFEGEAINYRKDGKEFNLEWQIAPIRNADGKISHFVAIQHDITERKRLEARLFQSQKMETVGKLAGGVAHEFNSILTAIIGQAELLLSDLPPDDPLNKNAREIRQAADRAATLTGQLLAYGRKQILQPEFLDLNVVLASMVSTLQHLVGREVDVRIVPASGLKTVKIDPGQMEQVLVNIAMNAADAMPNGGQFTIETSNVTLDEEYVRPFPGLKPGDYVMLALTDTGTGMSEEVKARVFEPFFSTKGVGQGTGLGMATCYGIVKQSDGHISIYSESARGTTLKIYLPQAEQMTRSRALPSLKSPDLPRGTETILLAEDDPSLLAMSTAFLRRLGYTVLTAANGVDALKLKHQPDVGHIDLLFTDVVMPHMSGKELSDRLRAIYPDTKILFTSAYTESAIIHQGVLNAGVTLLQKPFTPTALANKVREVLDRPSPSQP
jgi:two-component system, cell cycle sensor histidine kinase and response regulator CckA